MKTTKLLTTALLTLSVGGIAHAATLTWDSGGGDNNWSTDANWVGDPATGPVDNDTVVFAGTGETTNNDLAANTILAIDIQEAGFDLDGAVVDIHNTGTLDVTYSAAADSGTSTISLDLNATGGRDITVTNSGNTLAIDGQITSTSLIDFRGSGVIQLNNAGNAYTNTRIRGATVQFVNGADTNGSLGTGDVEFWSGSSVAEYIGAGDQEIANQFFIRGTDNTIRNSSTDGGTLTLSNSDFNRYLTGNINSARTATFDAASGDIIVTGAIRDNEGNPDPTEPVNVTKTGANTLTLSGVNEYTGDTTVSAGTLQIGGAGKLGGTGTGIYGGAVTIASGATFQYSSSQGGSSARYNGDISGDGTFIKDGSDSELRFIGNTSVATIEINQGTLRGSGDVDSLGGAGTTIYLGDTSGANDARLSLTTTAGDAAFTTKAGIVVRAGSTGTKTILSNGTRIENTAITLNDNVTVQDNATLTLGGDISGAGGLIKTGAGTTTLTGTNTFTGATTVNAGTLEIGGSGKVGDYTGAITIASGATFEYTSDQAGSSTNRFRGGISGDGTFVVNTASGSVLSRAQTISVANIEIKSGILNGQANASSLGTAATTIYLGDTSGSADAELRYSGSGGTFTTKAGIIVQAGSTGTKTISNAVPTVIDNTNITLNGDLTLAPNQHANNDRSLTLGGVISGAGGLIVDGVANGSGDPGVAILTGANTYSGNTTVTNGILQIGSAGKLESGAGTGWYSGNISVASGAVFQYSSAQGGTNARYFGDISGDGTLIKDTAGNDLRLFGNNSIANIDINLGEIRGAGANSLGGAGTTITLGDGGDSGNVRLRYSTSDTFTTKAGIVVAGGAQSKTIANDGGTAVDNTGITLDGSVIVLDNGTLSLGGNISGAGGLTKDGAGSTTLTGANSYGGDTIVNAGTLSLASGSSHSGSGDYTVNGGTLEIATGVDLSGHAMTIAGVISPGNSPGTAATGAQTWLDGGSYLWEINDSGGSQGADPGWDWLDITGALDLTSLTAGGFTIDIDSLTLGNVAGNAAGFDSYIQLDGIADYSFTIATASLGISGFDESLFTLDYSGFSNAPGWDWAIVESGNNLVLQAFAVPEPSSTALLGLGGLALMLRRKRS